MAEYSINIYDGSPRSFDNLTASGSGSTPFGIYDSEPSFSNDAQKFANYCASMLGYPIVDIELQDVNFYTCFEESTSTYGAEVNSYNIRNNILELQGTTQNNQNLTGKQVTPSFGRYVTLSKMYGTEAGSGGNVDWKHGSIQTSASKQEYDLNALWATPSESGNAIEIKKVYHEQPPTKARYFDPVGGYGTYSMMQQFGWADQYSPSVSFVMYPVYYDLLRMQAIEFNTQIRRSAFTFNIINNKLKVFPRPTTSFKLWFDYILESDRNDPLRGNASSSTEVSDYADVPYSNMVYSEINSVGQQWIRDYGLALSKEMLGNVRGKYSSIPIPDAEVTMDGDTLRNEAQTEKESLLTQLRETLEATGRRAQMEAKKEEAENLQEIINKVPLQIYIG